jgi:hypothetical protein
MPRSLLIWATESNSKRAEINMTRAIGIGMGRELPPQTFKLTLDINYT